MWGRLAIPTPEYKSHKLDEKSICFTMLLFFVSLSSAPISKYRGISAHDFHVTKYIFPPGLRLGGFKKHL